MINYFELVKCYEIANNLLKYVMLRLRKEGILNPNNFDNGETQVFRFLEDAKILIPEIKDIIHNKVSEQKLPEEIKSNQEDGDYFIVFQNNIILGIDLKIGESDDYVDKLGCIGKLSIDSKFTDELTHLYWTISHDCSKSCQIIAKPLKEICQAKENSLGGIYFKKSGEPFLGGIMQENLYSNLENQSFMFMNV